MTDGDLTDRLSLSDRHALVFGFDAAAREGGYESELRSLVAQASTNPSVPADRVRLTLSQPASPESHPRRRLALGATDDTGRHGGVEAGIRPREIGRGIVTRVWA